MDATPGAVPARADVKRIWEQQGGRSAERRFAEAEVHFIEGPGRLDGRQKRNRQAPLRSRKGDHEAVVSELIGHV